MSPTTFGVIVAAAIFLGIGALALFLIVAFDAQTARRLQRRLGVGGAVDDGFDAAADNRGLLQGMAQRGQKLERFVDKEGETARLLMQAGWRDAQSRLLFNAFQGVLPIVLAAGLFLMWAFIGGKYFQSPYIFMWMFVAFALAILIPRRVLRSAAAARQKVIKREVPLFAHLLVLLFEAGLSTRQALSTLVREGGGVLPQLGREFDSVVRQFDSGADTGTVLRELGEALAVDDLSNILSVLRQVDRYGGEVREPLLDMLKLLEERHSLEMRERVSILSGRMTVVMVLFFFPALIIFCVGPAVTSLASGLASVAGK
jgi:tight adherence protein C